jgi:hypothetical protein
MLFVEGTGLNQSKTGDASSQDMTSRDVLNVEQQHFTNDESKVLGMDPPDVLKDEGM